jgi:hypothetical protein
MQVEAPMCACARARAAYRGNIIAGRSRTEGSETSAISREGPGGGYRIVTSGETSIPGTNGK